MKPPEMYKLLQLLFDLSHQWELIGHSLHLSDNFLDGLHQLNVSDNNKLSKILLNWRNTNSSPFTWRTLIDALNGPVINNRRKAKEIWDYLQNGNS